MGDELVAALALIVVCILIYSADSSKGEVNTRELDKCQKHFNLETKNTTVYEQEKVLHKEDKPARIVIECEVKL